MLLKANSKASVSGRKRKRHEVFDLGMPDNDHMNEESKDEKEDAGQIG